MDLEYLEYNLKKCIAEVHQPWGRKQNNEWDNLTNFIYKTRSWEELQRRIDQDRPPSVDFAQFSGYAVNRWLNFWSAKGIEEIFCRLANVKPAKNAKDRLVDFTIQGIKFDHKTSVFPQRFPHSLQQARQQPQQLTKWLYLNQSQQQRYHLHNRLFIILYNAEQNQHWRLRAEVIWLKEKIERYVSQFNPQNLITLSFKGGQTALTDIIWAIK